MTQVEFKGQAERELRSLADSERKDVGQVLEDAIALKRWVDDTMRAGGKLFVQDKDGKLRELAVK